MGVLEQSGDGGSIESSSSGSKLEASATMETAGSEPVKDGFSDELDALYQLCCDEDAAAAAAATNTAISDLPAFTLSPEPDDTPAPSPPPPPVSPAVSLPTALLAHIGRLQSLCAESTSAASQYAVLLSRLGQLLPLAATPLSFRLAVVQLMSLLMLPPATTATSSQSFFSSHLYRLSSLLLPPSLQSSSVASALLRLVDSVHQPGSPVSRSVCSNVRKYVDGWKDERTRRRHKRHADDTTAYFAPGGDAQPAAGQAGRVDEDWAGAEGGGVVVAGKRRRRIEPDASVAALFPLYPTDEDEDKRATALIEQLRAEQKAALIEARLRTKTDSLEDEWRKEWRRWADEEDEDDAEELAETGAGDVDEVRQQRFWQRWNADTEWTRFQPSSLVDSRPRSSRPATRVVEVESKQSAAAVEEDDIPLSAAERAQVEAAINTAAGFSSMFFAPPSMAAPPPAHHFHSSHSAVPAPPYASSLHPLPMGQPFVSPFVPPFMPPFVPHEQSLHRPAFVPPHAFRGGMHR